MTVGWWLRHRRRFGILGGLIDSCLFPLKLAEDGGADVGQPDNSCNDSVSNLAALGIVCKLETETTVDDSEGDDDAAKPNMSVRPESAVPVFLVHLVVDHTEERLEEDEAKNDDTDDGVIFAQLDGG